MNTITIDGNLVAKPELRYLPSGVPVASFSIGHNRWIIDPSVPEGGRRTETEFFDVEVWRDQAERVAEELAKGTRIVVTGRVKQNRWVNEAGENRSRVLIDASVVGPSLQFAPRTETATEEVADEDVSE